MVVKSTQLASNVTCSLNCCTTGYCKSQIDVKLLHWHCKTHYNVNCQLELEHEAWTDCGNIPIPILWERPKNLTFASKEI